MKFHFEYVKQVETGENYYHIPYWVVRSTDLGSTVCRCENEVHAPMITYALNNTEFN